MQWFSPLNFFPPIRLHRHCYKQHTPLKQMLGFISFPLWLVVALSRTDHFPPFIVGDCTFFFVQASRRSRAWALNTAGWRLALLQWLVIQTDVVGGPHYVIWPRCRWRLCSQMLSWYSPESQCYCFPFFTFGYFPHEKWTSESPCFLDGLIKNLL